MPNAHTYNEAVETILFKQNALTILLFLSKLNEICHFGSDTRLSVYGIVTGATGSICL